MKQHKLGEMAIVENSGVDKKIKDEEKGIRLCNMNIPKLRLLSFMFVGFLVVNSPHAVATPDYIESRYYTRVAEAQLSYLQEDYETAYRVLLDLEAEIPLLNNLLTYEMPMLVELCLRYGDYEKACAYIKSLVVDHGFSIKDFEDYENFDLLKCQPFYDSSALAKAEEDFMSTDSVLVQEMLGLLQQDIAFRLSLEYPLSDSVIASLYYVDSCTLYRFKELLNQYGFPLAQSKRFTVVQRSQVFMALSALLIHWSDGYMEFLHPIVYQCVKNGDCPPDLLGKMFDGRARADSCFLYGMYMNVGKEAICDVAHLDERRAEIGLPPHRLYCQISMLRWKKDFPNDSATMFNCDF